MNEPLQRYFDAMNELLPRLSESERRAYLEWERSDEFTRNSDWRGWRKYLGPRPVAQRPEKYARRRRTA